MENILRMPLAFENEAYTSPSDGVVTCCGLLPLFPVRTILGVCFLNFMFPFICGKTVRGRIRENLRTRLSFNDDWNKNWCFVTQSFIKCK